jgi:hypothetical protein
MQLAFDVSIYRNHDKFQILVITLHYGVNDAPAKIRIGFPESP